MNNNTKKYYNSKQGRLPLFISDRLDICDPVLAFDKIMEEIGIEKYLKPEPLHKMGRPGYNRVNMLKTILFGFMDTGYASLRELEDRCRVNLRYMYLMDQETPSYRAFSYFINEEIKESAQDIFKAVISYIQAAEGTDLQHLYIDGSKFEANANKYTFVWRGSLNYHLAGLLDAIDALYAKYNAFLSENGYGTKYDLGDAHMFVIEGMDKVRKVIEENRKRKLTKHKKISNNTLIEIDHCSPLEILKLQKNLMRIAQGEGIEFVSEKGKHKPEIQKLYEELEECGSRLMGYKECFENMGKDRNSYSKTDLEATFMRMKEDHMLNGQLKPAYNVQIAVENYFIVHGYVSNDRTDYHTLTPVLKKHRNAFGDTLEAVTADSGYCSEKNLLYLKENGIRSYIKLPDHEKRKTRAYKEDIGKYYNMTYAVFEDERYYICHDGRELRHIRTESKEQEGYTQTVEVYGCADCMGCEHKSKCLYKYNAGKNPDRNKVMKINERWEELREESNANIQSEEGILKRQIRSIQTEGHFGDIKENESFRRFNYRSEEKVYKEFMLYAIGRNIMKYHRFLHHEIETYEGKKEQKAA